MSSPTDSPASAGPIRPQPRSKSLVKRACDQCKFRKIKCSLGHPCKACTSMGFDCTFDKPQKKRGPAGHRVSQIRQQQVHQGYQNPHDNLTPLSEVPVKQASSSPTRLPETPWPGHGQSMSVYGAGPAPNSAIDPSWSAGNAPMNLQDETVNWYDRGDAEHWLPTELDTQIPLMDFPGSNIYLKQSLPSMIQSETDSSSLSSCTAGSPVMSLSNILATQTEPSHPTSIWPASINEANMVPWIDVYFDRLHPTLPILSRSSLFVRLLSQEHRKNAQFGSMLLSLCAFSLTQPIEIDERQTTSSRATQARLMMQEAAKMRSCSEFGERPTIDTVLTSFFLFGCLFGSNQHNAAWLRLREALDLAATLGLNQPDTYSHLPDDAKGQRLRTYLVLSITERAYALQRRHPITFWGKPGSSMRSVYSLIHSATHSLVSGVVVHNEKDAEGMIGLARLMELFDAIDEDLIDCWNRKCNITNGYCEKLTEAKALSIQRNLKRLSPSEQPVFNISETPASPTMGLTDTQRADIFVTQQWLQNRVWLLCSTHGLTGSGIGTHEELSPNYAISIAESSLKICHSLRLSAMEAHGIGLVEKLYDIAIGAVNVLHSNPALATSIDSSSAQITETKLANTIVPPSGNLAKDFLLLLGRIRGGNHPFMERYKAHLTNLGF